MATAKQITQTNIDAVDLKIAEVLKLLALAAAESDLILQATIAAAAAQKELIDAAAQQESQEQTEVTLTDESAPSH